MGQDILILEFSIDDKNERGIYSEVLGLNLKTNAVNIDGFGFAPDFFEVAEMVIASSGALAAAGHAILKFLKLYYTKNEGKKVKIKFNEKEMEIEGYGVEEIKKIERLLTLNKDCDYE